ncbi:MAG: transglycosylase family protein [Rothia sp. (in: high G+C Gram-positive bacteria)]|nr:transglycosylase family protein [Rothia sp. (in: high G+C Gram-positive bacteria)]
MKKTSIRKNVTRSAAALVVGGAAVASMGAPAHAASESTWDALANCESGGNWGISTGNGFSGGLQFTPSTWAAFGGTGSPTTASKAEQIRVAENVLAGQGWGAWPSCSSQLGLSAADAAGTPAVASAPAQKTTVTTQAETVTPVQTETAAPVAQEAPVQTAPVAEAAPVVVAPAPAAAPVATAPVAEVAPVAVAPVAAGTYTVQAGDTLSEIAFANGYSSYWDLANANGIANPDVIEVGQVLVLPAA